MNSPRHADLLERPPPLSRWNPRAGIGGYEANAQPLYDSSLVDKRYIEFFQLPLGTEGKTRAHTNMEISGALPVPKSFLATRIHLDVTGSERFRRQFLDQGELELIIGCKVYLTLAPLGVLASSNRILGRRIHPRRFKLDESFAIAPLYIPPSQNFRVSIITGVLGPRQRVFCHLDGLMYRMTQ